MAETVQVTEENRQELIDKAQEARGEKPEETNAEAAAADASPEGDQEVTEEEAPETEKADDAEGSLDDLDFPALFHEFVEHNRDLTQASKEKIGEKLDKAGIPRELLDNYLDGLRAQVERRERAAFDQVGGTRESWNQLTEWAAKNLSEAEIETFNTAVQGTDDQAMFAIKGLVARRAAAEGGQKPAPKAEPDFRTGARPAKVASSTTIQSRQQLAQLMQDPRYARDPAFRAQVERDLRASMDSGLYRG